MDYSNTWTGTCINIKLILNETTKRYPGLPKPSNCSIVAGMKVTNQMFKLRLLNKGLRNIKKT